MFNVLSLAKLMESSFLFQSFVFRGWKARLMSITREKYFLRSEADDMLLYSLVKFSKSNSIILSKFHKMETWKYI